MKPSPPAEHELQTTAGSFPFGDTASVTKRFHIDAQDDYVLRLAHRDDPVRAVIELLLRLCAGWAGGHGDNLLALFLALIQRRITPAAFDATVGYLSPTPLFGSGTEAAGHG